MKDLKDEFKKAITDVIFRGVKFASKQDSIKAATVIEKLCEAEMIGFAEWTRTDGWIYRRQRGLWMKGGIDAMITSAELLTLYKNK